MYEIDFFRKINNGHRSSSKKETTLYELRNVIAETHNETIDYQEHTKVDGVEMPLIVIEYHGTNLDRDRIKKLEAPPDSTFNLGSKVECFGLTWLVTEINYNQEVKLAGRMQLCNYTLKWQDENGKILTEECVARKFNNTSSGEDRENVVSNNDTRRNVLVQFNEQTAKLVKGKRFFVDLEGVPEPKVYMLTNMDRSHYIYNGHGFFDLTFTEDEIHGNDDRPDLMIADYIEPSSPIEPIFGDCEIIYSGVPVVKVGGSTKYFSAVFRDREGVEVDVVPIWDAVIPLEFEGLITYFVASDDRAGINVVADENLIGKTFILRLSADDAEYGLFEYELEIEIGGLY